MSSISNDISLYSLKKDFSNRYAEIISSKIVNLSDVSQEGVRTFSSLEKLKNQNNDNSYLYTLGKLAELKIIHLLMQWQII